MIEKKTYTFKIWIKFIAGYLLFALAVYYGVKNAPQEFWAMNYSSFLITAGFSVFQFILQYIQVNIFIRYHNISCFWLIPILFTARKGVLNTILPARTGTIMLMNMVLSGSNVKWYQYIVYMTTLALVSVVLSLIATLWILLPIHLALIFSIIFLLLSIFLSKNFTKFYLKCLPELLGIGILMIAILILIFGFLLNGMGYDVSLKESSYFAIVSNAMAQLAITPGNLGIRECLLGMISPLLKLPVAVGIIVGAVFFVIRLLVFSIILICVEVLYHCFQKN